ncbi:MAG: glycosyltransferase [Candidatus Yanofskybacteria bacterium]|nr:glycosyltransferase [Candidatus Yanofskybacteria bacterium]
MITIVTVNFNNAPATSGLLRSLERQTNRDFDVVVVDNDSNADDRASIGAYAAQSPLKLDVIYSDRNRGFSGGNNLAIRKALAQGSDWILLINNDTTVLPEFVAQLIAQLPTEPSVVGIAIDEGARTVQAGEIKWLRSTLPHRAAPGGAATYAIGAGMLVHRDVFERIGLLDEAYFLYFEDADFSMRARNAGIPIVYRSQPTIAHRTSESTSQLGNPLLLRYHARNAIRFNGKNGPFWVRALTPIMAIARIAWQTPKILLGIHREESRAIALGVLDAVFGRWGRIPTESVIAIECESLEDTSWGVARMIRGALAEVAANPATYPNIRFDLYFKGRVPDEPWISAPMFRTHVVRLPKWLPVPVSFSLYYFVFLPIRLWFARPAVTYWPNYMLPIIAPAPSLVMLTEDVWYEARNPRRALRYRLGYRIFATWAARKATRIMAISHASRARVAQLFGIASDRIVVNELAVDTPNRAVIPMTGPYVLFVGQALERRHLREALIAFERIAETRTDLRFVAIGPDKYDPPIVADRVHAINTRLGRPAVQHIPWVSHGDLIRFYAGATALVYVSDVEAFGLPPLEALSYDVPAVLREDPLNREIYGEHAFYTPSGSAADIEAALRRALDDDAHRKRIRAEASRIISRYTWKAHAQHLIAALTELTRHS